MDKKYKDIIISLALYHAMKKTCRVLVAMAVGRVVACEAGKGGFSEIRWKVGAQMWMGVAPRQLTDV